MPNLNLRDQVRLFVLFFGVLLQIGCTVQAAKENAPTTEQKTISKIAAPVETKNSLSKSSIKVEPNSPADTVRVFYKNLRERRFREAMFLTNLRPAIESLTDAELKELHVDFEPLAAVVPAEIEINGEIITKEKASVTTKLPDNETEELKLQEIKLRRENNVWIILTVDEQAEVEVKREGKNYFTALKIKTHQEEAKAMLERVNKAQMVYAVQNQGLYADAKVLVEKGFLPPDFLTAESTGYNYQIRISPDRKKFAASATPAVYAKTGKLSYWFEVNGNKTSNLKNKDTKGQPLKF